MNGVENYSRFQSDRFDRSYKYDFAGRTIEAKAGVAVRGSSIVELNKLNQPTLRFGTERGGYIKCQIQHGGLGGGAD